MSLTPLFKGSDMSTKELRYQVRTFTGAREQYYSERTNRDMILAIIIVIPVDNTYQ